jgi:hypothetical protein
MTKLDKQKKEFSAWHVGVAAEAMAAAQFARLGFDVSVQYGADQPEYDLIISKKVQTTEILMKVSVKGSQDGSWGLTQSYKSNFSYHQAADFWVAKHGSRTIFCLVQFKNVEYTDMPRLYLATPWEIGQRLKETAKGRGDTILYEHHSYKLAKAAGYGTTEKIPDHWKFSKARIEVLFESIGH